MSQSAVDIHQVLGALGLLVLERGWLSSNNILFLTEATDEPTVLVDTGYATHAPQTLALLLARLGGRSLDRIVNTHLHSDHCGGNALLCQHFGADIWVPQASLDAAQTWDESRLTYRSTGQTCHRFPVAGGLRDGTEVWLGSHPWQARATPGHDPEAMIYFEPKSRVLIAGDALWRDRLAIIFPELSADGQGFGGVRKTLDTIESLGPSIVIPGHGAPFTDVQEAIAASRLRLAAFEREPHRHLAYAVRALAMFRMLEHRQQQWDDLRLWMSRAPILTRAWLHFGLDERSRASLIDTTLSRLIQDQQLERKGDWLQIQP